MSVLMLGAHMSIAGGVSQALDRAASVGSNAVQVFTKNNRQWNGPAINEEDVARWKSEMPALGIEYAVSHASYLINLASPKDDLWERSLNAHKDELHRAHAYGIPHVVLHPGAHTGSGEEAGIERIAAALNRIHAETPDYADTKTLLELMAGQGSTLGFRFAQLKAMIERVSEPDRVGVCLDTCHAFAAGYDLRTDDGYEAMMAEIEARDRAGDRRLSAFQRQQGRLRQPQGSAHPHRRRRHRRRRLPSDPQRSALGRHRHAAGDAQGRRSGRRCEKPGCAVRSRRGQGTDPAGVARGVVDSAEKALAQMTRCK